MDQAHTKRQGQILGDGNVSSKFIFLSILTHYTFSLKKEKKGKKVDVDPKYLPGLTCSPEMGTVTPAQFLGEIHFNLRWIHFA